MEEVYGKRMKGVHVKETGLQEMMGQVEKRIEVELRRSEEKGGSDSRGEKGENRYRKDKEKYEKLW